jgi:RNA polymerase sigma-70 factor (ECF subfamily)
MPNDCLPRDRSGWRALVRRVGRATRRPGQAEDLLHSAFLRLEEYRSRHTVENPAAFLVRVAVNMAVDERRHERVRSEIPESIHDLIDLSDDRPLHDEVLAARERLERVKAGLAELSPRTREIFLMHRIEGLKYREIAARLGITVSAVEKHVARAALFLAEWIEGW